jgi:DNA-binding Lrp family transcriptional regulator
MTEQPQPVPLADAAIRLGISPDAVRMRVRRGQLTGVRVGRTLLVYLDGPAAAATELSEQTAEHRTNSEQRTERTSEQANSETEQGRQFAAIVAERDWLRRRVEELTALLNREQEAVLRLSAAQAETGRLLAVAPTGPLAEWPSEQAAAPGADTVAAAAKAIGVRKRDRKALLRRLFGR